MVALYMTVLFYLLQLNPVEIQGSTLEYVTILHLNVVFWFSVPQCRQNTTQPHT